LAAPRGRFAVRSPFRFGATEELSALVYVLIEHQSAEDPAMPLRLLYFAVLYWERQWRAWEQHAAPKPALQLSPVLPLILYTGAGPWQNNRTLHDLLGEPAELHALVPQWAPLFWELCEHDADSLLQSGDAWQEVLAVLRAQGEEAPVFEKVYVEAIQRLEAIAGQDHVRWYDLMRIILSWGLWRRPREERQVLLAAAQPTQANVNRQKEVGLMGQTIAEAIWEEGRLKGHSEGEAAGELRLARRMLRQLLEERFGSVSETVSQRIDNATDVDRLAAAALQVRHLISADELQL
jgi:hypothetical protein